MSRNAWQKLVYCGFSLVFFVLVLVVIKWTIAFVDWAAIDSGWAQAFGSVAALGVAIFVMSRQNAHSARLITDADRRSLLRRVESVSALIDRAHAQLEASYDSVLLAATTAHHPAILSIWDSVITVLNPTRSAISAIPAHELGSYDMVVGLHKTVEACGNMIGAGEKYRATPTLPSQVIRDINLLKAHRQDALNLYQRGVAELLRS